MNRPTQELLRSFVWPGSSIAIASNISFFPSEGDSNGDEGVFSPQLCVLLSKGFQSILVLYVDLSGPFAGLCFFADQQRYCLRSLVVRQHRVLTLVDLCRTELCPPEPQNERIILVISVASGPGWPKALAFKESWATGDARHHWCLLRHQTPQASWTIAVIASVDSTAFGLMLTFLKECVES